MIINVICKLLSLQETLLVGLDRNQYKPKESKNVILDSQCWNDCEMVSNLSSPLGRLLQMMDLIKNLQWICV